MAAPVPIGFNFTKMADYNLTIDLPSTSSEYITAITTTANSSTNHYLTFIIMSALWVILYFATSDQSPFSEFKYSYGKAAGLSFGICGVMGITMLEAGFFTSFKSVAVFVLLFIITTAFVMYYENRE